MSSAIPKAASQEATLAKPNCQTSCGDIKIPYPFGMGSNCYRNNWFEVICGVVGYNNFIHRLTQNPAILNDEVLNFSVEGTLRIRNPITYFDSSCAFDSGGQAPNLKGSPFVFSQKNRFTSLSCGGIALMKMANESIIGGCLAICDDKGGRPDPFTDFNICNGINYCQITIPAHLTTFNTSFRVVNDASHGTGHCKYAFLVKKERLLSNNTGIATIEFMRSVPALLDWNLSRY